MVFSRNSHYFLTRRGYTRNSYCVTHTHLYGIQAIYQVTRQSNSLGENHIERIIYLFRTNELEGNI